MTIALGFVCDGGLVLAADSEMTTDTGRFDDDKIWYFKIRRKPKEDEPLPVFKVGVAGSGNRQFLIAFKEAVRHELKAQEVNTLDEAEAVIRGVLHEIHVDHIYKIGAPHERYDYNISSIIGIVAADGLRLLCSELTALTPVERFYTVGAGPELVRFLVSQYGTQRPDVHDAAFLASQVLIHGIKHVRDVGGDRRIMVLYEMKTDSGWVKESLLNQHEEFVKRFETAIRPVLFGGTNKNVSDLEFINRIEMFKGEMQELRKMKRQIVLSAQMGAVRLHGNIPTLTVTETPLPLRESQSGSVHPTPSPSAAFEDDAES
jgi:hypothetical protein